MTPHNKLTADEVLRLMSDSERRQACHHFWQNAHTSATANATQMVEALQNIGKGRLRKMGLEKQTVLLARLLLTPPAKGMLALVVNFGLLETKELPNLQTLLNLLPEVGKAFRPFSTAELVTAISSLRSNYSERQVTLLLAAVASLTTKNNSDVAPFLELPAALDYLEMNLRNSLAASRETQPDSKVTDLQAEVESLREELTATKRDLGSSRVLLDKDRETHKSAIAAANQQNQDLIAGREAAITQRVDTELSKAVRPWLEEARNLANMSATRTDLQLEEKVSDLLRQQEVLDLKYGSRARLKNRLRQFDSYAEKIRSVFEDSLAPHPDLDPLLHQLEVEIRHLRLKLKIEEKGSHHFVNVVEAINRAASEESLTEIENSISVLADKGVFSNREASSFYRRLHVAYDKLALKKQDSLTKPRLRSGWELRDIFARNRPATIYLDAHNLILQTVDCYDSLLVDGRITPEAEAALIKDVLSIADNRLEVFFRVVIDAKEAGEATRAPNVVVERAAGVGTDRADSAIILHASKADHRNDWFVVTEDRSLREQATRLGGVFAPVPIWQLMLENFGVRQPHEKPVDVSSKPDVLL